MTLPALAGLKSLLPEAQIDVLAINWSAPVYEYWPYVNRVIPYRPPRGLTPLGRITEAAKMIRGEGYEVAIALPNSFESALVFKLARIPKIYGYNTDFRSVILTKAIPVPKDKNQRHHVYYYLNLIEKLFAKDANHWKPDLSIKLSIPDSHLERAREILTAQGWNGKDRLIGINPGAAYGPAKCWPGEKYRQLASSIVETFKDATVVVFGTEQDEPTGSMICKPIGEKGINLCGKTTLHEAISVISCLSLMVTNDSGLMHVAAACSIPLVALFGSTNHVATGPWSPKAKIIKHELPCSPCMSRECNKDFICMLGITVEEVLEACEELLS
ncbi:MAG: lipopolysaccharide heptosyltransferase II [Thermodesulfobacteria bacterium]|nr:lipopolysaccharide heptosyltransferase II [Thermodesulfobacteriota bacterium]